jgi:hypothetical protein
MPPQPPSYDPAEALPERLDLRQFRAFFPGRYLPPRYQTHADGNLEFEGLSVEILYTACVIPSFNEQHTRSLHYM